MGQSPKFISYWRGPYQVMGKMSDVTYVVNCCPRGSNQVKNVDRMRLKNSQLLDGEKDGNCQENAKHSIDGDNDISLVEDDKFNQSSPKNDTRNRQICLVDNLGQEDHLFWLKDYEVDY